MNILGAGRGRIGWATTVVTAAVVCIGLAGPVGPANAGEPKPTASDDRATTATMDPKKAAKDEADAQKAAAKAAEDAAKAVKKAADDAAKAAAKAAKKRANVDVQHGVDALWGDDASGEGASATRADGSWSAADDRGSLVSLTGRVGARAAWAAGVTGKDVTVALVDTGVAPVAGLDGKGKVIDGPDLSYDGQAAGTAYVDGFGHGTHLAGIITGQDAGFDPKRPSDALFAGVAPEAQLLNMKVGAGDGGADVSQIIAALDWVVEHRGDHAMHVRVINLAYGTESVQPWQVDPLARAVENAWNAGIVVVAAAGNEGLEASSLLMPAVDPHVIAVGAVDHQGTTTTSDDIVAAFTNGGSATRRPDVLAPGKSVVSLRVPGSYADTQHPEGLVAGDASGRFFRGSGTSQASAVVSGEVALLLSKKPSLTPDEVKALLMSTAQPLTEHPDPAMGAGVTNVAAALARLDLKGPLPGLGRIYPASSGTGTLEASRGGEHVVDPSDGSELSGEVDALGAPWDSRAWVAASTVGDAWDKGAWNGRTWAGDKFDGDRARTAPWSGNAWNGVPWSRHTWSEAQWSARSWRNNSWKARSWRSESWSARSWRSLP